MAEITEDDQFPENAQNADSPKLGDTNGPVENMEGVPPEADASIAAAVNFAMPEEPEYGVLADVAASAEALKLLNSFAQSKWSELSFKDELEVMIQQPIELGPGLVPCGAYAATIQPCWYMDRDCYRLEVNLQYNLPDYYSSSLNIISYITPKLKTVSETVVESAKNRLQISERSISMKLISDIPVGDDPLTYEVVSSTGYGTNGKIETVKTDAVPPKPLIPPPPVTSDSSAPSILPTANAPPIREPVTLTVPPGFISRGLAVILDRILVRQLHSEVISAEFLKQLVFVTAVPTTDGSDDIIEPPKTGLPPLPSFAALLPKEPEPVKQTLCLARLAYDILPRRSFNVQESPTVPVQHTFELIGIERILQPSLQRLMPLVTFAYYLSDGHMALRLLSGSPVQLQLRYAPLLIPYDKFIEKPNITRHDLNWKEDMQLMAVFAERTEELKNEYSGYLRHKPELRALLADFLQALLLRKPTDILSFASQFFSTYAVSRPASSEVAVG